MKKKVNAVCGVWVLFFVLLHSCTFSQKAKVEQLQVLEEEPKQVISYEKLYGESYFNDTILNMDLQIVNSKNDSVSLSSIVTSPKIVVRYSAYSCKECINFTVAKLLEIKEKHSNVDVIFLLANVPVKDMHVMKSDLFNSPVFRIDSLPFAFDALWIPYLFRIDEAGNVSDMFVPQKELPDKTLEYLKNICVEK